MTTLAPTPAASGTRKFHSLKIDMTPMVDLGFLLITFFIFTATLSQPAITKLIMPADGAGTPVPQSKSLTVLLDRDKAFAYEGLWEDALLQNKITSTTYHQLTGVGNLIRQKQKKMESKSALVVLIKPMTTASYQNVVAALDEMQINNVKHYALVDATPGEKVYAAQH